MTGLTIRGQRGALKVGYQQAARLGPFTLTAVGEGVYTFDASVLSTDAFWLSQRPLTLEIEVGASRWSWRDVVLALADRTVQGTVSGRPQRR